MKNKVLLLLYAALICWLTAILVFSCTKNEETPVAAGDQPASLRGDDEEMPEEIAQLLTAEQIAAFWASKPTNNPANPQPGGQEGKRPKKWRPFFGWGDITSNNLRVLSNCTTPASAVLCYNPADCGITPGSPATPPVRRGGGGEGHMSGYGKVYNSWLRFICGGGFDIWNGTYEKNGNVLQYAPNSAPTFSTTPEYQILQYDIKVCNANNGAPNCWSYSTGDFADSEGILHQQLHVKRNPPGSPSGMYIENSGKIFTWGWLWY